MERKREKKADQGLLERIYELENVKVDSIV